MAGKRKGEELKLVGPSPEEKKRRELLRKTLSFIMPDPQAERTLEALLESFGCFSAIFLAPTQEISRISGVGEDVGRFLELVMELARTCMETKTEGLRRIYDTASAIEAFRPKFLGRKTEAVCLMLLDGRGRLIYNDVLSEGSFTEVPVYIRRLAQLCIAYNAQNVMLAHNHPSGSAIPSRNDIVVTHQVEMMLESIDAELSDHIIFAGEDTYSFLQSRTLDADKEKIREYRANSLEAAREMEINMFQKEWEKERKDRGL